MRHLTWFRNTRSLLTVWLGLSLAAILALAGMGGWGIYQIRANEHREEAASRLVEQAYQLKVAAEHQVVGIRGFVLTGQPAYLVPWQEGRRDFARVASSLSQTPLSASDRRLLAQIAALQRSYQNFARRITTARDQVEDPARILPLLDEGNHIKNTLVREIDRFIEGQQDNRAALRREISQVAHLVQLGMLGLSLIAIPLVLALAALVTRRIMTPLSDLAGASGAIGGGRYNTRVPKRTDDEFGAVAEGFNLMVRRIEATMHELAQQRQFSELILNAAGEGIFGLDGDGRLTFVNRSAAQLLGYDPRELIGKPAQEAVFQHGPGATDPNPFLVTLQERRVHHVDDDTFWRKDHSHFPVEYTSTPLAQEGEHSGAVVTFREITERLEAERASRLERERALAMAHAQEIQRANHELEQLNGELEAANRMKSEFLANMSHELRTPLNSIIGYAELVLTDDQQDLDPLNRENLDTVVRNARHLLSLINDILDISKIEAGKLTVYPEPFDPAATIRAVASITEPLARAKGLRLETHVPPGVELVVSDETKVRQIILNLVSNAIKFTRAGGVTIRLEPRGTERWAVIVRDTGIGIAPEDQGVVFEEFRQVDASTTREAGGTGLGLSISQKLARLLGGELALESEPGKGSTFTLELPRQLAKYQQSAPTPHIAMMPVAGRPIVLCIDDNPETLHLIAENLKGSPFEVVTATSGESGVALAKELKPFAITLDVMMPRMDGWMVLRALKADPATADIPVVILSFLENKAVGFSLGASGYLTKPIDRHELLVTLERLCPGGQCAGHVLIVEDDPDARALYAQVFGREGIDFREACNGAEALEALEREKPFLVILDLMMPKVDGFEVLARMRANPETRNVPVIVVTAKDLTPEDLRRLQAAQQILPKGGDLGAMVMDNLPALLHDLAPRKEAPRDVGR